MATTLPHNADHYTAKVAAYVNTSETNGFVADCTAEAMDLVARHIQGRPVPDPIVTRAVVETAADLFWRKQARAGVVDFGAGSESGPELVHVANDPLRAVRPMLAPYLPGGFA